VANIKSQIKRNRQNDKRRLRNRASRGTARIAVRNARTAMDAGVPESKAALLEAIRALDKAAEKGVIHKNNAARRKSRLTKAFAKMEPVKVEAVMVEPVAEPEPASSPKGKKKAAARKQTAKAEPKAEVAVEPKGEPKSAPKAKKTTAASTPKGKKATTKKATTPKKTTATSSPKGKKA
jgi:small subunit ribosomal protein S20